MAHEQPQAGEDRWVGHGQAVGLWAHLDWEVVVPLGVALLVLAATNQLAKGIIARRRASSAAIAEQDSALAAATAGHLWSSKGQAAHDRQRAEWEAERQTEQREKATGRMARARKAYGVRVVLPGEDKTLGGGAIEEHAARAQMVAQHEEEAPEREALRARGRERERAAALAKVERQRKAYGLAPHRSEGHTLAPPGRRSSEVSTSLVEEQDGAQAVCL
jgi:hypothetical protein